VVDGIYRLDEGVLRDDFFSCWHELKGLALMDALDVRFFPPSGGRSGWGEGRGATPPT
jgi:hypothetical protein